MKRILQFISRILIQQKGIANLPALVGSISLLAVGGTVATSVISQGDEASQEVEQVVQEAIQNVRNTFDVRGAIIGISGNTASGKAVAQLTFTVALAIGGGSVDFTPPEPAAENNGKAVPTSSNIISFSYTDGYQHVENLYWTLDKCGRDDGDFLLEDNEMFQITIGGSRAAGEKGGNMLDALSHQLTTNTKFNIEVKVAQGATLTIERTTPPGLDNIINLH